MIPIILGKDLATDQDLILTPDLFERHFHLIGATGAGKTTAILTMLRPILMDPIERPAVFIVDAMGNLSMDLLRWMANRRLCPEHVRRRLLYIEPARESVSLPFNPLIYDSPANQYYQVERAVSVVLRAWESQELAAMPRLRKWTFNSFFGISELGYPIATCEYLLQPGSDEHKALLRRLPPALQREWSEILKAHGNEAIRILESTRNRLDPFFRSVILRRMFGSRRSHFAVADFIRDRRIVILNLASYRRIPHHLASTIGALAVNEILETVSVLPREVVRPTYLLLDEFQNFVGPDIYDAIPTVRQQGLRLILSHQSFSQLEHGDIDLTNLIWQARSRLMFACDADDADRLAHEVAHLRFDPQKIKHQILSHKQRIAGHRKEWLTTRGTSHGTGEKWEEQHGSRESTSASSTRPPHILDETRSTGTGRDASRGSSRGGNETHQESSGEHEVNVPIHEDFVEVTGVTFESIDGVEAEWGGTIRTLRIGEPLAKFSNDPNLYHLKVYENPIPDSPAIRRAVQELIETNFASPLFVSAAELDREAESLRLSLLHEPPITITLQATPRDATTDAVSPVSTTSSPVRSETNGNSPFPR